MLVPTTFMFWVSFLPVPEWCCCNAGLGQFPALCPPDGLLLPLSFFPASPSLLMKKHVSFLETPFFPKPVFYFVGLSKFSVNLVWYSLIEIYSKIRALAILWLCAASLSFRFLFLRNPLVSLLSSGLAVVPKGKIVFGVVVFRVWNTCPVTRFSFLLEHVLGDVFLFVWNTAAVGWKNGVSGWKTGLGGIK